MVLKKKKKFNHKKFGVDDLITPKTNELRRIASKYGLKLLQVFGSVARGEATRNSDIDFVVDFEITPSFFDLAHLQAELEDVLSRKIDIVVKGSFKDAVAEDAEADLRKVI